ncbi:Conserved hypothetical protein [gamma proteobacterium HdN1]|nr:Conserved hypothetical protein [gamma proteobacterium HdN1]
MQEIYLEQTFNAPRKQIFGILSDHEKLGDVLGAKITRIRNGDDGNVNGKGSVRKLSLAPGLAIEETITTCTPDSLIEYTISKGSPLKNHKGTLEFSDVAGGTQLRYRIVFDTKYPIPFLGAGIRFGLEKAIGFGLGKLAKSLH